jgi:hypothetical protein
MAWLEKQMNVWEIYSQFIHDPRGLPVHPAKSQQNPGKIPTAACPPGSPKNKK